MRSARSPEAGAFTSLAASAPLVLLNAELGDHGSLRNGACTCAFGATGGLQRTSDVTSPEKFAAEGVKLLAMQLADEARQLVSRAGGTVPLVLEDADRAGYEEAALFHLLNQSMRDRRPVLITAREPVANWPFATDDLKSRARLAAHFTVSLSDDIQLSQMFVKLFGDRQIKVDPRIIAYLVARMERSAEEVVILADLMDRLALAKGTAKAAGMRRA